MINDCDQAYIDFCNSLDPSFQHISDFTRNAIWNLGWEAALKQLKKEEARLKSAESQATDA